MRTIYLIQYENITAIALIILSALIPVETSLSFVSFHAVDTTPPRIDYCPNLIEKVIPLHENGTFVTETPTVTDNSGQFRVLIEPEIRDNYFSTGLTKVNYIYTDPSGNTATCEVNIHVIKSKYTR